MKCEEMGCTNDAEVVVKFKSGNKGHFCSGCLTTKERELMEKSGQELQAEADAKATPNETWQAIFEEGVEEGQSDALNGVDRRAEAAKVLDLQADHPFWRGYIEGYQDGMWVKGMRFKEESKCDFCENTKLAAVYRPKDGRPMCACEDHVEIVMEAMERGGIL